MKILTPFYHIFDLRAAYRFFDKALPKFFLQTVFNWIYKIFSDPFDLEKSNYEAYKFDAVAKVVQETRVKNALDIGCGTGILTEKISSVCEKILGVDFSENAINSAKKRFGQKSHVAFFAVDVRHFEPADTYDLVLCSEVLYYIGESDLQKLLVQLWRTLSDNGRLIVIDAADDDYAKRTLSSRFQLVKQQEERNWFRPFAIRVFKKISP